MFQKKDTSNIDLQGAATPWHEYPMVSVLELYASSYCNINASEISE